MIERSTEEIDRVFDQLKVQVSLLRDGGEQDLGFDEISSSNRLPSDVDSVIEVVTLMNVLPDEQLRQVFEDGLGVKRHELLPADDVHLRNAAGVSPVAVVNAGECDSGIPQIERCKHHVRRIERVHEVRGEPVSLLHSVRLRPDCYGTIVVRQHLNARKFRLSVLGVGRPDALRVRLYDGQAEGSLPLNVPQERS